MSRSHKQEMKDQEYEMLLHIETSEVQHVYEATSHYHRYEPTSYGGLHLLLTHYEWGRIPGRLVDFGCGKGRVSFYWHYMLQRDAIGIERQPRFFQEAQHNLKQYEQNFPDAKGKLTFIEDDATRYPIDETDTIFYFFHPFSLPIFMKVIENILQSLETFPRRIVLILYYAHEDYHFFLQQQTMFQVEQVIEIPSLYENNSYEAFTIYSL
ncbi:methyltransferase [Fictibacillus macauensis ZFHKF-1]|uniref:Methyltransferase n=1 Tax=Fictibacillus macauensis ZFHKF-1 TaxID=1196324 RepID=I8UD04_9BACL|nr:class I SAM-dependent methyltransferase [Fictibacillus macauensis]EIT84805.1 methyltransferase [Fictibacillus macauensis ZFHKF-1]